MRVMIVEDNELSVSLTENLLRAAGHEVLTAFSGEEALRQRETWKPDVAILDLRLPGICGMELLRKIRAITKKQGVPKAHVILASAVPPAELMQMYKEALAEDLGPVEVLEKPYEISYLIERLKQIQAKRECK
jgi:CheY-like chemotaxis protein